MVAPLLFLRLWPRAGAGADERARRSLPTGNAPLRTLRPWRPRLLALAAHETSPLQADHARHVHATPAPGLLERWLERVPGVEPVGPWGAFLDVAGFGRLYPDRRRLLSALAEDARAEGYAGASGGEGRTRMVARLAAAVAPPRSYWSVPEGGERGFLAPYPLRCAGRAAAPVVERLEELGVRHFGDLAALPAALIAAALGDDGLELWREARGQGGGALHGSRPPALHEEHRFEAVQSDPGLVRSALGVLADRIAVGLRGQERCAGSLLLWVHYHGGGRWSRRRTFRPPRASLTALREAARGLWSGAPPRRTGVVACGLVADGLRPTEGEPLRLDFAREAEDLTHCVRRIRERFGSGAIAWSTELWMRGR